VQTIKPSVDPAAASTSSRSQTMAPPARTILEQPKAHATLVVARIRRILRDSGRRTAINVHGYSAVRRGRSVAGSREAFWPSLSRKDGRPCGHLGSRALAADHSREDLMGLMRSYSLINRTVAQADSAVRTRERSGHHARRQAIARSSVGPTPPRRDGPSAAATCIAPESFRD